MFLIRRPLTGKACRYTWQIAGACLALQLFDAWLLWLPKSLSAALQALCCPEAETGTALPLDAGTEQKPLLVDAARAGLH